MPDSPVIRAFLAARLDPGFRRQLTRVVEPLQRADAQDEVRWSLAENVHLSIQFYGNQEAARLDALAEALRSLSQATARIDLHPNGLSLFPRANRPRVLALTFATSSPLNLFVERAHEISAAQGIQDELRPFRAHVTLGRFRKPRPPRFNIDVPLRLDSARMDHLAVYQSELLPEGPRYTVLHAFDFKPGD